MQDLLGDLTSFEKQLVDSHDLVTVRGKRGRPVPILIPEDVQTILALIADHDVRRTIGVDDNELMFANSGKCISVVSD
jgi:hypothetical protein